MFFKEVKGAPIIQKETHKINNRKVRVEKIYVMFVSVFLLFVLLSMFGCQRTLRRRPLYTATQVATWQATRKTAIEPVFDLLSRLLSITRAHKPLPLRGLAYVSTFLGIGILLLQLAMLMNARCGLPTRNVTHIKTVFR